MEIQKNNLKPVVWIGSIAILYFIIARISLSFIVEPENIAVIWPLSGLFLAAVLITNKKLRPWLVGVLFITDFIVEMLAGSPPFVSLFYSFSLAFDAAFSAWLLIKFVDAPLSFNKSKHVFLFILLSVVLSNALAASISAFAPRLFLNASYWESWRWWWTADAVGNLLVTPFILSWYYFKKIKLPDIRLTKMIEGTVLTVSLIFAVNLVFKNILSTSQIPMILSYLTFPFLIWAALRFGVRGVTSISLILSVFVLGFLLKNPYIFPDNESLINAIIQVQLFIAVISIASLFLATVVSEREQVSKSLTETEIKYEELYENAPDMFVSVDPETAKIIRCNETLLKNIGYTRYEVIGHQIFEMYHPDCMEDVKKAFQQFADNGKVKNAELQLKRKDGSKIDVILNVTSVCDENGNILYSNSSWNDITERKKIEEKVRKNEEQFRTIFEQSASGMCVTGIDGKLINVNKPLCEMLEFTEEELIGKHFNSITHPDDIKIGSKNVREMLDGKTKKVTFEKRYLKKSGEIIWVNINSALLRNNKGNPEYFITQMEDITQRINADKLLITSENKYKALVEQSLTGIYIFEKERFLYVNKRFCEIFGYSEEEIISSLKPTDVVSRDERETALENIDKRLSGKVESVHYLARGNHKEGKTLWIEIHGTHLNLWDKDVITGTVLDITEWKVAEEKIKKLNEELEQKVLQRTQELENKISEIGRINNLFIGREIKMRELKQKIKELEEIVDRNRN